VHLYVRIERMRGATASHPDNLGGVMLSPNALVFNL